MKGFSMETKHEIWDDDHGSCVEVGPDRDGLDLVEIRQKDETGKIEARMSFPKEQAALISKALALAAAA